MPLEAGTFIPELNANNPLGADPKSEGDDHLRLIKRCTLGSFPAFVGNAGDPKSVSLTEDQINDAALKSETATISAEWQFNAAISLFNDVPLFGLTTGVVQRELAKISASNIVEIGNGSLQTNLQALSRGQFMFDNGAGGQIQAGAWVDRAVGGLLVRDIDATEKKVGFRNPTLQTFSASFTPDQTVEGRVLLCTGSNPTVTVDQLEAFTTYRIMVSSSIVTLLKGNISNMRWLDGGGSLTSIGANGVQLVAGSVMELYYQSSTTMYIWGNGISEL